MRQAQLKPPPGTPGPAILPDGSAAPARILCVDDEPNVLEGLERVLGMTYTVTTAVGGLVGIGTLTTGGPFAAVISDMRMPSMSGADFLTRAREIAPDTVRLLLTGFAETDAVIRSVNDANAFRILVKPCPEDALLAAVEAAVTQHTMATTERALLDQTIHGSVKVLAEVLALASPLAFGRASRIRGHVSRLAPVLAASTRWQLEVAALLSELAWITLPPATADRVRHGKPLKPEDLAMVDRLPEVTARMLANIPRLEAVHAVLLHQATDFDGSNTPVDGVRGHAIPWGARVLKIVRDFDDLERRGVDTALAVETLRARAGSYDPALLEAFATTVLQGPELDVQELPVDALEPGMLAAADIVTRRGTLAAIQGQELTVAVLERFENLAACGDLGDPIRVLVPR